VRSRQKTAGHAGRNIVGMSTSATAETLNQLTSSVLEAAIRIHRALGPGLLENAYFTCLVYELTEAKFRIERQRAVLLVYKGVTVDCAYRAERAEDAG
jgi:hypothetical protein